MNTKLNFTQSIKAGAFAAITAAVINALLFFVFHSAGVLVDTIFIQPETPLTIVPVLFSSILPSLVASIVFFLFEKYSANGFKFFSIVAVVLLLLSFINPFVGIKDVTIGYAIVLNVMHVVVAAAVLYFINKAKKAIN
jgi:drug/metabolite transporter (DMT)-like permease